MTRNELIEKLKRVESIGEGRIVIKEIDYTGNRLAPQKQAWSICYTDISGNRRKAVYHGEVYGFQWSR